MVRRFLVFLFMVALLLPMGVFAQENEGEEMEASEVSDEVIPEEVGEINTFELFWPVVAGRTQGDALYPLKRVKEKFRGWLIFGAPQRADYHAFLATKRVVEADSLMSDGKDSAAEKTLNSAVNELKVVEKNISQAKKNGDSLGTAGSNTSKQLNNIETFLKWRVTTDTSLKDKLQEVLFQVVQTTGSI
jgi:hypothetical protein